MLMQQLHLPAATLLLCLLMMVTTAVRGVASSTCYSEEEVLRMRQLFDTSLKGSKHCLDQVLANQTQNFGTMFQSQKDSEAMEMFTRFQESMERMNLRYMDSFGRFARRFHRELKKTQANCNGPTETAHPSTMPATSESPRHNGRMSSECRSALIRLSGSHSQEKQKAEEKAAKERRLVEQKFEDAVIGYEEFSESLRGIQERLHDVEASMKSQFIKEQESIIAQYCKPQ